LATKGTGKLQVEVGEFVALREKNEDRWLPANICWVTGAGQELRFGVTLMAPFLEPGKAYSIVEQDAKAEVCILLLDSTDEEPYDLLLCPPCLPAGTQLRVETDGKRLNLILQEELSRTPGYVEYHCVEASK
jgi:hypothetical protein